MKKKIFVAAVAAIVAVGAAWNLNQDVNSNVFSDLTLNNVEALTGESVDMCLCEEADDCCYCSHSGDDLDGYMLVYES